MLTDDELRVTDREIRNIAREVSIEVALKVQYLMGRVKELEWPAHAGAPAVAPDDCPGDGDAMPDEQAARAEARKACVAELRSLAHRLMGDAQSCALPPDARTESWRESRVVSRLADYLAAQE